MILISISRATLLRAQSELLGCEACSKEADRPFTWTLDRVSGQDPSVTDYILSEPAKCPRCQGPVFEETLVEASVEMDIAGNWEVGVWSITENRWLCKGKIEDAEQGKAVAKDIIEGEVGHVELQWERYPP